MNEWEHLNTGVPDQGGYEGQCPLALNWEGQRGQMYLFQENNSFKCRHYFKRKENVEYWNIGIRLYALI